MALSEWQSVDTFAYLVHANIQRVMRFCVNLELDFWGCQLERAALGALPPQHARDGVHAPQVHAELVLQPLVVYTGLRLCICQRRPAPAMQHRVCGQGCTTAVVTQPEKDWPPASGVKLVLNVRRFGACGLASSCQERTRDDSCKRSAIAVWTLSKAAFLLCSEMGCPNMLRRPMSSKKAVVRQYV